VVVNPTQARALEAVRAQQPSGLQLVPFFGVLYSSGLRLEEAVALHAHGVLLTLTWDEDSPRCGASPMTPGANSVCDRPSQTAGKPWTDGGADRDRRGLKHRAEGESRPVPCPPALTTLLRDHLTKFASAPSDLIFRGVQGRPIATITYGAPGTVLARPR
jgi:hypothetical protein